MKLCVCKLDYKLLEVYVCRRAILMIICNSFQECNNYNTIYDMIQLLKKQFSKYFNEKLQFSISIKILSTILIKLENYLLFKNITR